MLLVRLLQQVNYQVAIITMRVVVAVHATKVAVRVLAD